MMKRTRSLRVALDVRVVETETIVCVVKTGTNGHASLTVTKSLADSSAAIVRQVIIVKAKKTSDTKVETLIKGRAEGMRTKLILLLSLMTSMLMAQKTLTLEDVMSGGNNWYNLQPENKYTQW